MRAAPAEADAKLQLRSAWLTSRIRALADQLADIEPQAVSLPGRRELTRLLKIAALRCTAATSSEPSKTAFIEAWVAHGPT
jgi:hypothetical protein